MTDEEIVDIVMERAQLRLSSIIKGPATHTVLSQAIAIVNDICDELHRNWIIPPCEVDKVQTHFRYDGTGGKELYVSIQRLS